MMESNQPWWLKSIWTLGPVTVFAGLLFAVFMGWLPSPIMTAQNQLITSTNALVESLNHNRSTIEEISASLKQHTIDASNLQVLLNRGLRRICRNTSKTQTQNEQCDDLQ